MSGGGGAACVDRRFWRLRRRRIPDSEAKRVLRVIEGPANSERAQNFGDLNRIGDRASLVELAPADHAGTVDDKDAA